MKLLLLPQGRQECRLALSKEVFWSCCKRYCHTWLISLVESQKSPCNLLPGPRSIQMTVAQVQPLSCACVNPANCFTQHVRGIFGVHRHATAQSMHQARRLHGLQDYKTGAESLMLYTDQGQVQQQAWRVWVTRVQQNVLARWHTVWRVLSQYLGAAMRLHLALFYFYGLYYHWSKRATGESACDTLCYGTELTWTSIECMDLFQLLSGTFVIMLAADSVQRIGSTPLCKLLTRLWRAVACCRGALHVYR